MQNIGTFKKLQVNPLGEVFEVKKESRHMLNGEAREDALGYGLAKSAD